MRAARLFAVALKDTAALDRVCRVEVDLHGSLGATGRGHRSDAALILGLEGETPEEVDTAMIPEREARVRSTRRIRLLGEKDVGFSPSRDIRFRPQALPGHHPNTVELQAFDENGLRLAHRRYASVGGGAVMPADEGSGFTQTAFRPAPPFPFTTGSDLLRSCRRQGITVADLVLRNELALRSEREVRSGLLSVWRVMRLCARRGLEAEGRLPGRLDLPRRASQLEHRLETAGARDDWSREIDRVSMHAIAVAEENAAGGRVVTAPTNGSAGIVPAVLGHAVRSAAREGDAAVVEFLLAAGGIGLIFKATASVSGAEVGCQGEIGVACSMAAAGLAQVLGATPDQVERAAEIGMEHNLGLTCDPVDGLVQVPCIERNALGAVMAITAARLALQGSAGHLVSLDTVIKAMLMTGRDMRDDYKETARGGLAAVLCGPPGGGVEC
jgi:L-serine dehydratase